MGKATGSASSNAQPKLPGNLTNAPCPTLEKYKALQKGRHSLCTPVIDKAGGWSWRGKQLEVVWDAMVTQGNAVEQYVDTAAAMGDFTERLEVVSGDIKVFGGLCRQPPEKGKTEERSQQVAFAVRFGAGKLDDEGAVEQVLELPLPLAFVCVHILSTLRRLAQTQERILDLLNPKATTARADVLECMGWMRERLSAVERSPQAILTRCTELDKTCKEMHTHYLKQVQARRASAGGGGGGGGAGKYAAAAKKVEPAEAAAVVEEVPADEPVPVDDAPSTPPAKKTGEDSGEEEEEEEEEEDDDDEDDEEDEEDEDDDEPRIREIKADDADASRGAAVNAPEEADDTDDDAEDEALGGNDGDDHDDLEDEASWPSSIRLHEAQREVEQQIERHRAATRALERAAAQLEKAKADLADASDALHDDRAARYARREEKEARRAKAAKRAGGGATTTATPGASPSRAAAAAAAAKPRSAPTYGQSTSEAAQVAELKGIESNAPAPIESLLKRLRGLAGEARPTSTLPLNVMAFLAHCSVVVQCELPSADGKKGGKEKPGGKKGEKETEKAGSSKEAVGRFYVAFGSSKCVPPAPPPKPASSEDGSEDEDDLEDIDDEGGGSTKKQLQLEDAAGDKSAAEGAKEEEEEREEESVALVIAQNSNGDLCGAVGWYPLGSLPESMHEVLSCRENLPPPRRCMRIDDDSWESMIMMHMTLQGYGDRGNPVVPMGMNLRGCALFHFAAGLQHYFLAREQIDARLCQNRASNEERQHIDTLMDACHERFITVGWEAAADRWLNPEFTKCESASQGLRKTLLKRPWCKRCPSCGVRHEDIEFSTCKFWQAWVV